MVSTLGRKAAQFVRPLHFLPLATIANLIVTYPCGVEMEWSGQGTKISGIEKENPRKARFESQRVSNTRLWTGIRSPQGCL